MKVISTNIGQKTTVFKNGKTVQTGIYKTSVSGGITLGLTDVVGDAVMDRENHGGIDKACYIYSADHYNFWKKEFPDLHFTNGMFGENLTVEGLDESTIKIGDTFEVGSAIIQVSEPRRPCSILGIRFGTQKMVKKFNNSAFPGIYVRVIKEGHINIGDQFKQIETNNELSVKEIFGLFATNCQDIEKARIALQINTLSEDCKNAIRKRFKL